MANKKLATIRMPDGTTADIVGPEESSKEDIMAKAELAKQQWTAAQAASPAKPARPNAGQAEKPPQKYPREESIANLLGGVNSFLGTNVSEPALAVFDLGKTLVTGALGRIAGGVVGGAGALLPGEENQAADWQSATEQFITLDLFSKPGERLARQMSSQIEKMTIPPVWRGRIGPTKGKNLLTLKEAGQDLDDLFLQLGAGNPEIAAGIRAFVYGAPDVFLGRVPFKGTPALTVANEVGARTNLLKSRVAEVADAAEKVGYKLSNDELPDSIVAVADAMSPERHAAANVDELGAAVQETQASLKQAVDKLYAEARTKKAVIEIVPLQNVVDETVKALANDGFDLRQMKTLATRLEDFKNLQFTNARGTASKIDLNQAMILERRLTNDLMGKKRGEFSAEDVAILRLRNAVRGHMDDVFNRGAITGDPAALEAWKAARGKAAQLARFDEDRLIRNLVREDASPEQIYRWVIGASGMGAKKEAVATIRRLKEVLGDDHPALMTVRNAVLRDVLMPAFADTPNFKKLIVNIDKLVLENPTLMKELAIPVNDLVQMKAAAHAANKVRKPFPEWVNRSWLTRAGASIIFGHQIARKGTIVRTAHKLTDALIKTGQLTRKEILNHLVEMDYTSPAVVPKSPLWADIMVRGAISDLAEDNPEEDQFE